MNSELAQALRSALDGGTSLAELETTLLTGGGTTEEIDAAWLYAWAYDDPAPAARRYHNAQSSTSPSTTPLSAYDTQQRTWAR